MNKLQEQKGMSTKGLENMSTNSNAIGAVYVSALEAENERLRDRVEFLVRHIHEDTPLQWVADELHAILQPSQSKDNREQEKQ